MSEWRSRPPRQAQGLAHTWFGWVVRELEGGFGQMESCHSGSHRSAEAALACTRRTVRRLNKQGGAR